MNLQNEAESASRIVAAVINPECIATIVLPVRDEAELLAKNLASFAFQLGADNRPLDPKLYEIIILANNCRDRSAAIACDWQRKNRHLNIHVAETEICRENSNIGFVRGWLMTEAWRRLRRNRRGGGLILTTDADTTIASDWLAANLREISGGADAVGGRILIGADELEEMNEKARRFYLLDTAYRLLAAEIEARLDYVAHDYLPRHHQHFNASFAVTTAAFERAGGVPKVRCLEDVAFYHALLRVDARFRHSPRARVETSARHRGRTETGLSTQIGEWMTLGASGENFMVESAGALAGRIRLRQKLRFLWRKIQHFKIFRSEIAPISDSYPLAEDFILDQLNKPQTFGCLYENIVREQTRTAEWTKEFPLHEIERALFDLQNLARRLGAENALAAH